MNLAETIMATGAIGGALIVLAIAACAYVRRTPLPEVTDDDRA